MDRSNPLRLKLAGAALACLLGLPAAAQTYATPRFMTGAQLLSEPEPSGVVIDSIPDGERLERLDTAKLGYYWKVRWMSKTGPKEGWVVFTTVKKLEAPGPAAAALPAGAPAAAIAQPPQPPAAPAAVAASPAQAPAPVAAPFVNLARLVQNAVVIPAAPPAAAPASAVVAAPAAAAVSAVAPQPATPAATQPAGRGHAVIFGISQYKLPGVSPLLGVPHDMTSANIMAQLMGITQDRITVYREDSVTKESITAALQQLAKEVKEGEPVLVYYSGHGSRYPDPSRPTGCIEGLLTARGDVFTSQEMSRLLQPLASITDGLFVFFDACFSGALAVTRDTGNSTLRPKFALTARAAGDLSNCDAVNDMRKRPEGTRAANDRYIYAGAARFDEMSLDDSEKGGLATTNFLNCMVDGKSRTVEALRACAQAGIERRLTGDTQFKAHHMTITGDLGIQPVRRDLNPAFKQQILATLAASEAASRPATSKAAYVSSGLLAQGWPEVYNPAQAFAAIAARSAPVPLAVEAPETLRIRTGRLQFKVQAPADGFVYVFQATGDGKNAYMLFPNLADRDNRIRAGQTLDLPRASWALTAGGPEGDNQLLVVFSPVERDLAQLVGQVEGPFLDLAVSPTGMQALALAVSRSAVAEEPECKTAPPASRPGFCAPGYSASLKTIREVR
ncbi:MAG: DUF4384 domain-containing protein [Comamonadaceae bacterium]|nr:MAG: DUF4384 domain-containing protein [Comamonadaceae bacterium]